MLIAINIVSRQVFAVREAIGDTRGHLAELRRELERLRLRAAAENRPNWLDEEKEALAKEGFL